MHWAHLFFVFHIDMTVTIQDVVHGHNVACIFQVFNIVSNIQEDDLQHLQVRKTTRLLILECILLLTDIQSYAKYPGR